MYNRGSPQRPARTLKRAGEMIQQRFKGVKVNFYTGGNYPTPPNVLKQAGTESDVVIGATAD